MRRVTLTTRPLGYTPTCFSPGPSSIRRSRDVHHQALLRPGDPAALAHRSSAILLRSAPAQARFCRADRPSRIAGNRDRNSASMARAHRRSPPGPRYLPRIFGCEHRHGKYHRSSPPLRAAMSARPAKRRKAAMIAPRSSP